MDTKIRCFMKPELCRERVKIADLWQIFSAVSTINASSLWPVGQRSAY